MSMLWSQRPSDAPGSREFGEGDSLKMIPMWSIILAVLVFVGTQYFFNSSPPPHRHDPVRCRCTSSSGYTMQEPRWRATFSS